MYFADHPPPHFHVITVKEERISVVIETLVIQAGEADPRDTAEAMKWARTIEKNFAPGGGSTRSRWLRNLVPVDRFRKEKS